MSFNRVRRGSFCRGVHLNTAMSRLTKERWEFAGVTYDEFVMKRPLAK